MAGNGSFIFLMVTFEAYILKFDELCFINFLALTVKGVIVLSLKVKSVIHFDIFFNMV